MERTASTLNAKEQTAPASAALAEIGPVYIRERSPDYSRSQSQLSQKLSPDSSPMVERCGQIDGELEDAAL
ncbi:hypothetical protein DV515_00013622 [Chloebia gouldiae]|uniref:Uncharacterized protein n=1 Tax=Chloebia gouldiae TaxID=44316 RepID=A0A3L8S0D7_CHLGU|nr:hypothetical protein DV515_00013622 [Chloebia gouldiae]